MVKLTEFSCVLYITGLAWYAFSGNALGALVAAVGIAAFIVIDLRRRHSIWSVATGALFAIPLLIFGGVGGNILLLCAGSTAAGGTIVVALSEHFESHGRQGEEV